MGAPERAIGGASTPEVSGLFGRSGLPKSDIVADDFCLGFGGKSIEGEDAFVVAVLPDDAEVKLLLREVPGANAVRANIDREGPVAGADLAARSRDHVVAAVVEAKAVLGAVQRAEQLLQLGLVALPERMKGGLVHPREVGARLADLPSSLTEEFGVPGG